MKKIVSLAFFTLFFFNYFSYATPFDEELGFYEASQIETSLSISHHNAPENESLNNNNGDANSAKDEQETNNSQKQIYGSANNEPSTIVIFLILLIGFVLTLLIISYLPIKRKERYLDEPSKKKNNQPSITEKLEQSNLTEWCDKPKAKSATMENGLTQQKFWRIFHCSIQGKDHLKAQPAIPCQDNHYIHPIDDDWGVAVVCDGAGSHKYSHIGSKFVSEFIATKFADIIKNSKVYKEKTLPEDNIWRDVCKGVMYEARQALDVWINQEKLNFDDINIHNTGCTVILTIYSPYGLLVAHIGDGRAGYRDAEGWHSMMTPFKGEYANQTVFLNTKQIYTNQFENLSEPDNPYLETRVIRTKVNAFVLMSDGCENGLYNTVQYDEEKQQNININRPIAGLDSVIQNLMKKEEEEAKIFFEKIMREGNKPLKEEGDDKTLVLAIFNQ